MMLCRVLLLLLLVLFGAGDSRAGMPTPEPACQAASAAAAATAPLAVLCNGVTLLAAPALPSASAGQAAKVAKAASAPPLTPLQDGMLMGLGGLAVVLAVAALLLSGVAASQARRDGGLRFRSDWGGFGGTGGGWQIGPAGVSLLAAALLASCALFLVMLLLPAAGLR